jgi:gliding motility-associated protein GldM
MAGGKETPRQKMIGLMYLVLTALLALNVSKQILDAFVAIEDNIQRGSITQYDRGETAKGTLIEELSSVTKDEAGRAKAAKIKKYLGMIEKIDKDVAEFIKYVDDLKLELIEKVEGPESVKAAKPNDKESILWKKYDPQTPLLPTRLYLQAIQQKDNFDVPMHEIVGSEISKIDPTKKGQKLWDLYNGLRKSIVETAGTYKEGEKNSWRVKVKDINDYKDFQDLSKQIEKMIKGGGNKVNPEDMEALLSIYQELTKQEFADHHEAKNIHWLGRTFDHAPLVGALASLSSLQNEILSARAKAVNLLKSKVTTGEFSFNKIQQLVSGPGVATSGEEVELLVTMAAYDSDKNPVVTANTGSVEVKDGIGRIKLKAGATDMTVNGSVTITNKSGVPYKRDWEWKVAVVKAQGSISLPEMMVLYRGYENKVVPVVAGAVSSEIRATNVTSCSRRSFTVNGQKFDGYIVTPGGGKEVVMSLTGKDKDGKSKSFGTFTYKVRSFPSAKLLGGKTISKSKMFDASVGLEDASFTGVSFTVIGGKIIAGDNEYSFTGAKVPPSLIDKVKVGKRVGIEVSYKRSGSNDIKVAADILKVTP